MRTIIADDEAHARRRIRELMKERPEFETVAECATARSAIKAVRSLSPELLFLDVQMPGHDGFGVLRELGPSRLPIVIFVTAYDEYALAAFEARAVDYLLKPFDDDRFHAALDHAATRLREVEAGAFQQRVQAMLEVSPTSERAEVSSQRGASPTAERFAVRKRDRIVFVRADDIDWVEASGDYVRLHTADSSFLLRATMREMERRLDSRTFLRVHRSHLVRADRIERMSPDSHGDYSLELRDGTVLRLTRNYRAAVRAALGWDS